MTGSYFGEGEQGKQEQGVIEQEPAKDRSLEQTVEKETRKQRKFKIVSYYKTSGRFRECAFSIYDWNARDGAKFDIKSIKRGKTYSKETLELITKEPIGVIGVGIARQFDSKLYVDNKGTVSYDILASHLKNQELLANADVIEVLGSKFTKELKSIGGTLYCTLFFNLYKLKQDQKSKKPKPTIKEPKPEPKKEEPVKPAEPKVEIKTEEVFAVSIKPSN